MSSILAKLTSTPFDPGEVSRMLAAPENGAELVFWGVVRDQNQGRRVRAVTYDAHAPLAEKTFREIAEEACGRWGEELRVVILHRTGRLAVGEASVVIGVASAHRDEAYQASRYVIEQLKLRSPIWKQEHYLDGDSEWLDGHVLSRRTMETVEFCGRKAGEHPAALPHPSKLFVEVTTRCNLRCAMCVKQAPGQAVIDGDMSDETFARLAPALPRIDALVLNGIGESLLHPRLERYIEAAKRVMAPGAWVGFQTNGQLLDRARALSLVEAGVDRVCVSADAVAPEVFRAVRKGGKQAAVETALDALEGAAREVGRVVSLGVEFVAMRSNVEQLPDVVRWASRNHTHFVIVTHLLPYNEGMVGATAFDTSSDRALELFREWKGRAAADGVDVERYFEVFMRFRRSPEEERIVEYVARMVEDASSRGISLNLARLLRCDEPMLRRVREIFDEAEEVARREQVDLRLPATSPRGDRRCDFVEDGSAFVSWEGDLHPCYFLWHRYRCYVGGAAKQVRPQSFGNLREGDVLQIWNGAAWRAFRDQARQYQYPSCHDCNVALCDYVQGEDFTQDCHLGTVPCPACLWCTGVFQCLR